MDTWCLRKLFISSWNAKFNMYPEGMEREQIVKAMDVWIAALVKAWTKKV